MAHTKTEWWLTLNGQVAQTSQEYSLLMPKKSFSKEVRKKFKATGIKNAYYEIGTDINLDLWAEKLARELSDIFNVSVAAARIRLKNLGFVKYDLECKQYSLMLDS